MAKVKKTRGSHSWVDHFLHRTEWLVNKSIPFAMILLAAILAAQFTVGLEQYEPWVTYADYFIVGVFVLDLAFKWAHTKKITTFVKLYWIEILAVFPFYLVFRVYQDLAVLGEGVTEAQRLAHEASLIGKETQVLREARLLREAQLAEREIGFAERSLRFAQRFIRLLCTRVQLVHQSFISHQHKHS